MWQTRGLYLLLLVTVVQVDQVLCQKGVPSKSSSDDELLESSGNGSSSEDLMETKYPVATKAHDNDAIERGKHDHTSAFNSTTPRSPSGLTNSTSIANSTSAVFANSTSGLSPTTGSPSLSSNRTRKESSTPPTPGNSKTQIPNNGTTSSAHGHSTIPHWDSLKNPYNRNSTGNFKEDSTRATRHLESSPQNSTTESSNGTSPSPSNVTSTPSPINVTTAASSHDAASTENMTVTPDLPQHESSLSPFSLAWVGDTMEKDSRDIYGSTGMLNSTSHGDNSTASANSTAAHNLTATALHHNSTVTTHENLKANTTTSTPVHNSTLLANSTATPLHCQSQPNCTANHTQSSPPSPSKEPQVLKITSDTAFNFIVNHSDTGLPCLLANMSINLEVLYVKSDQTVSRGNLHVPSTAKSNGTCTGRHAELILMWKEKGKSKVKRATATVNNTLDHGEDNILVFNFINDGKMAKLDKVQASIFLDAHNFPNSSAKTLRGESKSSLSLFTSKVDTTIYVCDTPTDVKAGDIDMTITSIALIAFTSSRDLSSIKVENCQAHTGLNIGAVIGGIIAVALIISIGLYLIAWRKKNSHRSSQIP